MHKMCLTFSHCGSMSGKTPEQYNTDLATRQVEINEWAYNNKMDTLFVFQMMFIGIVFLTILMYLKVSGILGNAFVLYIAILFIIIMVLIIINRSMFTNSKRDGKFWNRRRFEGDNTLKSPGNTDTSDWSRWATGLNPAPPASTGGTSK